MTFAQAPSACPACIGAPLAVETTRQARTNTRVVLSLPGIHCAACIQSVEAILQDLPQVASARVNFSRKRVEIFLGAAVPTDQLIDTLITRGFDARELDDKMPVNHDAIGSGLLIRLAVAGFAMMNVMLFSVAIWSGATDATRDLFHWISAGIALPTIVFCGQPFFNNAIAALRGRRLNMDVPISLAILLAGAMSFFETTQGGEHAYFDAALSLTFFLLVGRYLDHRTRRAARSAAEDLSALEVARAILLKDSIERAVAVDDLQKGDIIKVTAGMRIPVDGIVISGDSQIDRSFLTGETLPVTAQAGFEIAAGEINLTGPLKIEVRSVGEDTSLRRMASLVAKVERVRNRYTGLADRAAQLYAPLVHLLALAAFIGWMAFSQDLRLSLNIAISVLIITCPCALGLAVPAVSTIATGRLFRRGVLVKSETALERLSDIDTVVFDKTGTLSEGRLELADCNLSREETSILKALADASSHPVSRAIGMALPSEITPARLEHIKETAGLGISAQWNGKTVCLGRGEWLGAESSPALKIEDSVAISLAITETLRAGARETCALLEQQGIKTHLLTGDGIKPAGALAARVGIQTCVADMLPEDKLHYITQLQSHGHKVLMVGDGLNDTAALSGADASISPATALDAARTASDIVLLAGDLREVPALLNTAKSAKRRIVENFAIAICYNSVAIPIALVGYATPLAAALAMSGSSITVLLNAMRVR